MLDDVKASFHAFGYISAKTIDMYTPHCKPLRYKQVLEFYLGA